MTTTTKALRQSKPPPKLCRGYWPFQWFCHRGVYHTSKWIPHCQI